MSKSVKRSDSSSQSRHDDWHLLPSSWKEIGSRDYSGAGVKQVFRAARVRIEKDNRRIAIRYVDAVKEQVVVDHIGCYIGRDEDQQLVVDFKPTSDQSSLDVVRTFDPDNADPASRQDLIAVWRRWRDELSHTNASPPEREVGDR